MSNNIPLIAVLPDNKITRVTLPRQRREPRGKSGKGRGDWKGTGWLAEEGKGEGRERI